MLQQFLNFSQDLRERFVECKTLLFFLNVRHQLLFQTFENKFIELLPFMLEDVYLLFQQYSHGHFLISNEYWF